MTPDRPDESCPAALIFVVDDNATLAEYAAEALRAAGYDAQDFSDPDKTLAAIIAAARKPDVLVTDFDMGRTSGLDLIREAQKAHPGLKTLLLSGTIDEGIVQRNPGMVNRFLGKPYRPAQLAAMVAELLAQAP